MIPRVLFLCTGNSARSQMAEGLLRHISDHRFEAVSAGTHPVGVNPIAVAVMEEIGIDITHHRSKHISEYASDTFESVVTVCDRARESCPLLPGATRVFHWSFEDPAAACQPERLDVFRRIRDEIAQTICDWLISEKGFDVKDLACYCCGMR